MLQSERGRSSASWARSAPRSCVGHGAGGPADLGDLERHVRPGELVDGLAEAGDAHLGVGHARLVGVESDPVEVAAQVGAVSEHALEEGDLVGAAALGAKREAADHDVSLGVDHLDRRAGGHVEVGILLGRLVLRVPEGRRVLLVPDLVARDRELRQARVRLPEAAAAPVALSEGGGVGGEVGQVVRGDGRVAVARGHAGPVRRVVDDRVPADVVLGHRLGDRVVHAPVVGVLAARARRLRLDVGPAGVDPPELRPRRRRSRDGAAARRSWGR